MDFWTIVRWVVWGVGLPIIVWLTWRAVWMMRRIRKLHEELLLEEEHNPKDPYARLAEIESAKALLRGNQRSHRR